MHAVDSKLAAELDALRAKNAVLEEDVQRLKEKSEGEFADMTDEQLREFITSTTGHAPHGSVVQKDGCSEWRRARRPRAAHGHDGAVGGSGRSVRRPASCSRPTSIFSGITGNRTMQEMLALANEMAQRIAYDTREWQLLKKIQVFNGDGVTEGFIMPANFKRMLVTANVWRSTSALHPMRYIPDIDDWMQRRALNRFSAWGEWTMMGGQMLIWPTLGPGITATFPYSRQELRGAGVGRLRSHVPDRCRQFRAR